MVDSGRMVSVVIPVYNGERYLSEAIESVLAQEHRPLEVLVVDDGSTDNSASVAESFGPPVRCIHQQHAGAGAARNRGAGLSGGALLAFLDADDLWMPDKLAHQMHELDNDENLEAVFGKAVQFVSPELEDEQRSRIICPTEAIPSYLPSALLIRREAFVRIGQFSTSLRIGETVDWYARAREQGLRSAMLPEVVYRRRLHASNQGISRLDARSDYARLLKASLDRRREQKAGGKPGASDKGEAPL